MRRLLAAAAAAVLAAAPLGAAAPPAHATDTVCVEIVVDYGQLASAGAPGSPSATCVTVAGGSTGSDVLAARARKLGRPAPRWENGLLCAIDGYPKSGCGESDPNGGYDYWSYWHAVDDGPWTYSTSGAGTPIPDDGHHHAEGWAWVQGGAEGSRQPAHVPYASVCPVSAPTPAAPATTAPAAASAAPLTATRASAPATTASTPSSVRAATTRPLARVKARRRTATAPPSAAPSTGRPSVPVAAGRSTPGGGNGALPATVAGAAVVAGLGGAAVVRFRRRP